jgi:hypothetical protein
MPRLARALTRKQDEMATRKLVNAEAREPGLSRELPLRRPDEVLVLDPRGCLTAAQMVERKLLALLRTGNPGLYDQAAGGAQDIRRIRGGREDTCPLS